LIAVAIVTLSYSEGARTWLAKITIRTLLARSMGDLPPAQNETQEAQTVMVMMQDGTKLETHIYLPVGKGPWPTIVVRDPYGLAKYVSCEIIVRYGYACVHQDVRGRFGSEGDWYPLIHERNDGLDTLKWVIAQPWQNGKIGLWGSSYLGLTQWSVADQLPPEVKTFAASISHGDFYEMIYHNGAFRQGVVGLWASSLFQPLARQLLKTPQKYWRDTLTRTWPANAADHKAFGKAWPSYADYLKHPQKDDPYWHSPNYEAIRASYKGVHVPVMITERWYDFFLPGTLKVFEALPTRDQSLMVIEPGDHAAVTGDLKVTAKNGYRFADTLAWFDHFLKGTPLPHHLRPGYVVYVNGADRWEHIDHWPGNTEDETLYLADLDRSHRCDGGKLAPAFNANEKPVSYTYDPRNPVPTRGGSDVVVDGVVPTASADQKNDLCARPDVLSFASGRFTSAKRIDGGISAHLIVSSSAPDTAFTVKLSEEFADGRVLEIRDDISTLALRNGASKRLVYQPGSRVELTFDLPPIAWQMQPGSRLRFDITSSNFPAFNAHPNRAELWSTVTNPATARQTIHGGSLQIPIAR
jgi:putative CocE/NonD family hydrolase